MAAKTMEGRLPTAEELAVAYRQLIDGTDPLATVAWQFRHVIGTVDEQERPDFEPPTLETIGRLFVFATDALSRLDEIREYTAEILEKLVTLDEVRLRFSDRGIWGA